MANTVLLMWCVIMGVAFSSTTTTGVQGKKPPATFIFGDSLVDAGNNNYIFTLAAANHKPYGIDWPDQQATGRFCNGKIIPDLISKLILVTWKIFYSSFLNGFVTCGLVSR